MDDISREDEPSSAMDVTPSESTPADSMSSQGAKNIYAKEAEITINYNSLDEDLKDVSYFHFEKCIKFGEIETQEHFISLLSSVKEFEFI